MGIDGFFPFVRKLCPELFIPTELTDCRTKIVVDLNGVLYMLSYGSNSGQDIITKLLKHYVYLIQHMIEPIFIMDGKTPYPEKMHINIQRHQEKEQARKIAQEQIKVMKDLREKWSIPSTFTIDENTTTEILIKSFPEIPPIVASDLCCQYYVVKSKTTNVLSLTSEEKRKAVEVLRLAGATVHEPEGMVEAEGLCAMFTQHHPEIKIMLSSDSDSLVFGCRYLLKFKKTMKDICELISRKALMKVLAKYLGLSVFTDDMLIDVAILSGCDFCEKKIKNIGFKKALVKIGEWKTIEQVLQSGLSKAEQKNVPENFLASAQKARAIFKSHLQADNKYLDLPSEITPPRTDDLAVYLEKIEISPSEVRVAVDELQYFYDHFAKSKMLHYVPFDYSEIEAKESAIVANFQQSVHDEKNQRQQKKRKRQE